MSSKDKHPSIFVHTTPRADICKDGGEHDFKGWRDFKDGTGGEQICTKCGIGAIAYTLAIGDRHA